MQDSRLSEFSLFIDLFIYQSMRMKWKNENFEEVQSFVLFGLVRTNRQAQENVDVYFVQERPEFVQVNIRHVVHKIFESISHLYVNTNGNEMFSQDLVDNTKKQIFH
jgi:hypothetical protein